MRSRPMDGGIDPHDAVRPDGSNAVRGRPGRRITHPRWWIALAALLAAVALGPLGFVVPAAAAEAGDDAAATAPALPGDVASAAAPKPDPERAKSFDSRAKVHVWGAAARAIVRPGEELAAAVVFDHAPHWHIHTNNPVYPPELGDTEGFIKAELNAQEPQGVLRAHSAFLGWPAAKPILVKFSSKPVEYGVFSDRVVVYVPVTVAADAKPGEAELTLLASYQACNDRSCMAPVFEEPVKIRVRVAGAEEAVSAEAGASTSSPPGADAIFSQFPQAIWPQVRAAAAAGKSVAATLPASSAAVGGAKDPALAPMPGTVKFDAFGLNFSLDAGTFAGFVGVLLVAALGGLLLNFTPCVLPVIPIKIMGLSRSAGSRGRMAALGAVMSLGVIAFWLAMALVIGLVSGFTSTNQLFQYPAFTVAVGVVIAVMAVGMCGLFTIGLPQWVYMLNPKQETLAGSFGFGVMTAVLSTPCTAPFMGGAAAWAVGQAPVVTWMTFGAIGAGMASPYLAMALFPGLVKRLPRTGPGSELIKQVMGLFMLSAAAFFIGTGVAGLLVEPPAAPTKAYWWVVAGLAAAGGGWLAYRSWRLFKSPAWRGSMVTLGVAIVLVSGLGAASLTRPGPVEWVGYTPARLAEARAAGKTIVVDFTAEWCLNCKVLEANVLHTPRVLEALRSPGVVPMKVDLTGRNAEGNRLLSEVGRVAIPTLVVFAPDGKQTLNADAYTIEQVVTAIRAAQGGAK